MASSKLKYKCVWLDKAANISDDNKRIQEKLRKFIGHLRTFDDSADCEQYISKKSKIEIILIVSGGLGRQLIPKIHHFSHIRAAYVYCQNKKVNEEWAKDYKKINGVFVVGDELIERIVQDQTSQANNDSDFLVSIFSDKCQNLESRQAAFLWFQLFIEIILHMQHKPSERKELVENFRQFCSNDPKELSAVTEFEKGYSRDRAIWWYTSDSFFHRILNQALRSQNFDTLFAFRSFITDISKQIQREYEYFIRTNTDRNIIQVYRGQFIDIDELQLIKTNIGEFLSMNSFLSTSRIRSIALQFAATSNRRTGMRPILFEISIDPRLRTKPFADIRKLSRFEDENEILIMLGALFKIKKVYHDTEDDVWVTNVSLADEDDFHLQELFKHMKMKIGEETNLDSLGKLLIRMNENDRAKKCYQKMLEDTQLAVADARLGLGWSTLRLDESDASLCHFQESLRIRQDILGSNHASVGEAYSFIGEVHRIANDYDSALVNLKTAVKIQENTLPHDSLDLAATYDTLGTTNTMMNNYDEALKYFKKVLQIRTAKLPSNHPQLCGIYANLAWLYDSMNNSKTALAYYEKSLAIGRQSLPSNHPYIRDTPQNIQRLKSLLKEVS